jgi:hypothetical protein
MDINPEPSSAIAEDVTQTDKLTREPTQKSLEEVLAKFKKTKPKLRVVTRKELEKRMEAEKKRKEDAGTEVDYGLERTVAANSVLNRDQWQEARGLPITTMPESGSSLHIALPVSAMSMAPQTKSQLSITQLEQGDVLAKKPGYSLEYVDDVSSVMSDAPAKDPGYSSAMRYAQLSGNKKGYYLGPTQARHIAPAPMSIFSPSTYFSPSVTSMPTSGLPSGMPMSGMPSGLPTAGLQSGMPMSGMPSGLPTAGLQSGMPMSGVPSGLPTAGLQSGMPMSGMPTAGLQSGMLSAGPSMSQIASGASFQIAGGVFDDNLPPPRNPSAPFSPELVILPDPTLPFVSVESEDSALITRTRHKIDRRILPWALVLMLCINTIDDPADLGVLINQSEMTTSLNLPQDFASLLRFSLAFGVPWVCFPIVHALFFIKVGPRLNMSRQMALWGVLVVATIGCTNLAGLLALRVFQGAVGCGGWVNWVMWFPLWYPGDRLATRYSFFTLSYGLAFVFLWGLTSAFELLGPGEHAGLESWQWLNVTTGTLTLLVGMLSMWIMSDYPRNTPRLFDQTKPLLTMDELRVTEGVIGEFSLAIEERNAFRGFVKADIGEDWLANGRTTSVDQQLQHCEGDVKVGWGGIKWSEVKRAITDWKSLAFYLLSFSYALAYSAALSQNVVNTVLLKGPDTDPRNYPELYLPQFFVGFVFTYALCYASDRLKTRFVFLLIPLVFATSISIALSILPISSEYATVRYALCFCLVAFGFVGEPIVYAYRLETGAGVTYHTISLALMISAGNLAYAIGPFIYGTAQVVAEDTDGYAITTIGNITLAVLCSLAVIAVLILRKYEPERTQAKALSNIKAVAQLNRIKEDQAMEFARSHIMARSGSAVEVTKSGSTILGSVHLDGMGPTIYVEHADGEIEAVS